MDFHYQLTREETIRWYTLMTASWRVGGFDRRFIALIGVGAILGSVIVGWLVGGVLVSLGGGLLIAIGLVVMAAFPRYIFPRAVGPGWGPGANPAGSLAPRPRFNLTLSDDGVTLSLKRAFGLGRRQAFRRWSAARIVVLGPNDIFVSFGISPILIPARVFADRAGFEEVSLWAEERVPLGARHHADESEMQPLSRGAALRDNLKRQGFVLLIGIPIVAVIFVVSALRD